jgi:hypothetical protein
MLEGSAENANEHKLGKVVTTAVDKWVHCEAPHHGITMLRAPNAMPRGATPQHHATWLNITSPPHYVALHGKPTMGCHVTQHCTATCYGSSMSRVELMCVSYLLTNSSCTVVLLPPAAQEFANGHALITAHILPFPSPATRRFN